MADKQRLNVYGSTELCKTYVNNVHSENMKEIENEYQLNRLKENNKFELERTKENHKDAQKLKELEIQFQDHVEKNKRDMIAVSTKAEVDKKNANSNAEVARINATGNVDTKLKEIDNKRQKDKEEFELKMEAERN